MTILSSAGMTYTGSAGLSSRRDVAILRSKDLAEVAGITLRQVQWWSETGVLQPEVDTTGRAFSLNEALVAIIIARGRRALLVLNSTMTEFGAIIRSAITRHTLPRYACIGRSTICFKEDSASLLIHLTAAVEPVLVVDLWEVLDRLQGGR